MKKRFFAAALALALTLGLAAPAGLVVTAKAAVSASDAQAYLDILDRTNPANSFLIDFDGNGRDELLTVNSTSDDEFSAFYSVYQGNQALLLDKQSVAVANLSEAEVCSTGGKYYICSSDYIYSTVQNGQWVTVYGNFMDGEAVASLGSDPEFTEEDWAKAEYIADGKQVSEEEYDRMRKRFELSLQRQFCINDKTGDVRSQLEELIRAEALKNATPEEILAQIPYYGDRSKCAMTAEQAAAFAATLEQVVRDTEESDRKHREDYDGEWWTEVEAALCDAEGNGNPALLIFECPVMNVYSYEGLDVYIWKDGAVQEPQHFEDNGSLTTAYSFGESVEGGYVWNSDNGIMRDEIFFKVRNGVFECVGQYIITLEDDGYVVYIANERLGGFPAYDNGIKFGPFPDESDAFAAGEAEMLQFKEGTKVYSAYDNERANPTLVIAALRAYADAAKYPTYTYPVAEAGDAHYADVTAAVSGQGTIQAIYRLLEDAYYVLLENQGSYTGALVRGARENGKPVWKVTQTDPEPAAEDALTQLVNRLAGSANLSLDFGELRGSPKLEDLTAYLRELLSNIDGLSPNDPAKSGLAAFVDGAVASLGSGAVSGKDNRLALKDKTVSKLAERAREAYDALSGVLGEAGVELNKTLDPVVRVLWSETDESEPCQLTLDDSVAGALDGFGLQVLLGDGQTYVQLPADGLSELTRELGTLSVQLFQEETGVYDIRFLDEEGEVVERLSRPVTIGLPASGEFCTVMASYAGGSDNWGGQYDAASGTLSFETGFSGQYEVLENNVAIDDIADLDEESRAAIAFMASKGYFSVEDGAFRPGDPLNRYEFTEALVNMFFALDRSLTATFPDVPADSPYYAHVASAQARNIVSGFDDGTFGGQSDITREQVFALAARTLIDYKGYTLPEDAEPYLTSFGDRAEISGWAEPLVALSVREGVAKRENELLPLDSITREQAAVVLYRLFQLLYEVSPVALEMPEGTPSDDGLPVGAIVGISAAVATAAAAGAVVLLRKKPKAPKEES